MSLNLDKPHGCKLCKQGQEYLVLDESLYGSPNVYHTMFGVFQSVKAPERHRMHTTIDFPEFKHHFEHHVSSLKSAA